MDAAIETVINSQRLSLVLLLQLPGDQCNQQFEINSTFYASVKLLGEQCNQNPQIHSGGFVATAGIVVPSGVRGQLEVIFHAAVATA